MGGGGCGGGSERSPRGVSAMVGMGGVADEHPSCAEDIAAGETAATSAATCGAAAPAAITTAAGGNDCCTSGFSVKLEGPHGVPKQITKGDNVEYRWGPKNMWYRCAVSMLKSGGIGEEGGVIELEFLSAKAKNNKSDCGKFFHTSARWSSCLPTAISPYQEHT